MQIHHTNTVSIKTNAFSRALPIKRHKNAIKLITIRHLIYKPFSSPGACPEIGVQAAVVKQKQARIFCNPLRPKLKLVKNGQKSSSGDDYKHF